MVDDDPAIVKMLHDFFRRLGHIVKATTVSTNALGWIRKGERFDIVITDQMMPEVTGIEIARSVALFTPGTKILLLKFGGTNGHMINQFCSWLWGPLYCCRAFVESRSDDGHHNIFSHIFINHCPEYYVCLFASCL